MKVKTIGTRTPQFSILDNECVMSLEMCSVVNTLLMGSVLSLSVEQEVDVPSVHNKQKF